MHFIAFWTLVENYIERETVKQFAGYGLILGFSSWIICFLIFPVISVWPDIDNFLWLMIPFFSLHLLPITSLIGSALGYLVGVGVSILKKTSKE
ncbi:MAG: hypothetical protein H6869_11380 [Rhodospirillales bacterium]|nr:hypothetical protein [Rhodospirillales bacterium]